MPRLMQTLPDLVLEHAPAGIAVLQGERLVFRYTNPAYRRLLRLEQDVVGQPLEAVFPRLEAHIAQSIRSVIRSGRSATFEDVATRAVAASEDSPTYWTMECVPIDADRDGAIDAVTLLVTDITEQRRTEAALRESERRLRGTFENAAVGIAHVDLDGRWLRVNARLTQILGYSREELFQRSFQELTHPDDLAADLAQTERLFRGEISSFRLEKRYIRKDGGIVWAMLYATLQRDDAGRPLFIIGVVEDISEQHQLRQRLQRFAQTVAHDLRTPLSSLAMNAGLLERLTGHKLAQREHQLLERILRAAGQMADLIDGLLEYARASQGEETWGPVDLEAALRQVLERLEPESYAARAVITHDPLPTVTGNPVLLTQVLQNLIGNALKYRSEARPVRIHIGARQDQGEWILRVRDNGIGIAPERQDRLFHAFSRAHPERPQEGLGLGLALVREAAEHHGGRAWVESQPGVGSTFYVALPRRTPAAEGPAAGRG